MGQNSSTRNWTAGCSPCFHLYIRVPFWAPIFDPQPIYVLASRALDQFKTPTVRRAVLFFKQRTVVSGQLDDELGRSVEVLCLETATNLSNSPMKAGTSFMGMALMSVDTHRASLDRYRIIHVIFVQIIPYCLAYLEGT